MVELGKISRYCRLKYFLNFGTSMHENVKDVSCWDVFRADERRLDCREVRIQMTKFLLLKLVDYVDVLPDLIFAWALRK